jgi:hypothetical protein
MLAVVVADVEVEGDWQFARRQFGATPSQLRLLTEWLVEHEVEEVVMESTAQYWHPVWDALERDWQPTQRRRVDAGPPPARCISHRRSRIMAGLAESETSLDAERLVKRLVAHESAADHRGSRPHGDDVPDCQAPGVMGGRLSRTRGECRRQSQ